MRLITILLGIAIYQSSGPYVKPAEQRIGGKIRFRFLRQYWVCSKT